MHPERLSYLLKQYLDHVITAAEFEELSGHLRKDDNPEQLQGILETMIGQTPEVKDYAEADWEPLYQKVLQSRKARVRRLPRRWMAAAALLLLVGTGFIWYRSRKETAAPIARVVPFGTPDLAPGGDKAVLTLADGRTIDLDAAKNGVLGQQGDQQLIKNKNAQLVYRTADNRSSARKETIPYNVLTTPRGGQYQLLLPDGSKVWLNAATTLRYPTSFSGAERTVELKGEAYFEITADAAKPFRVLVQHGDQPETAPLAVEVLGTHFNIMDYDEEPVISTTLLEGSVRVRKGGNAVLLKPGQQARLNKAEELRVLAADTEEAIAWKEGMFRFKDAGIEQVMRQLARWYDVEVVYVNGVPRDRFQGEMYRNVNASKILKVLEASGVHFTVEGKKINLFMDKAP